MNKAALIILDGWGMAEDPSVSAIDAARTPCFDRLRQNGLFTTLQASGRAVGLPEGQMGNSEVGHLTIGAGRVIAQELERIQSALDAGELDDNPVWRDLVGYCKHENRRLHLVGLVSDGGVHSSQDHLHGLLDALARAGVQAWIHVITDGRDCAPTDGLRALQRLEAHLQYTRNAQIATVVGRYYAMDRDRRWERTAKAWKLYVLGEGEKFDSAQDVLKASYARGVTDEFVLPAIVADARLQAGDPVLFFNFRTDRCRQIVRALALEVLPETRPLDLRLVTMTVYDDTFPFPVLFDKYVPSDTLGEVLSHFRKTQLRIAETEKYPHVTFFFNGGVETAFAGEERILCPSPKVATYDLAPEMSAREVERQACEYLRAHRPDFVCLNFANADMVGHTGVFEAAVAACEAVDECLGKVVETLSDLKYKTLIIADHGNADRMRNPDGSPHTAHTLAPVPCILLGESRGRLRTDGGLRDVAPTVLRLMNLPVPSQMTGASLWVD
ncbi:MAG: 2,3-bisphosphoglycerate-independent phosphoglycerate mutase [Bacteroidia bacterium]|nr:2,3-bisphosphoglycerate-independent phosphoglycerate mutase [Bacteroidia bacterium]